MADGRHADRPNDEMWRGILTGEHPSLLMGRWFFKHLPFRSSPRCKLCQAPFEGIAAPVSRLLGRRRWHQDPNVCTLCEFYAREYPGGAEIDVAMLFADVRGSTALAERMSAAEFGVLIRRFYAAATSILSKSDAIIDKLLGDAVVAIYLPGFAGPRYIRRAIDAGRDLLAATGHGSPDQPWLPLGVGIHAGPAFVGSLGPEGGIIQFTALGDTVNVAARLSTLAASGELLVSDSAYRAAGSDLFAEPSTVRPKGHQPIEVRVFRSSADPGPQTA